MAVRSITNRIDAPRAASSVVARREDPRRGPIAVACVDKDLQWRICGVLTRAGLDVHPIASPLRTGAASEHELIVTDLDEEACESVRAIVATNEGAQVVVVAGSDIAQVLPQLFAAGAAAVVLDDRLDQALVPTIDAVRAGQSVVPASLRRTLVQPALTGREKQTLGLVVLGLSNAEIALKLHLTVSTVKSHLRSAFRKLGVRSRNEATALILDPSSNLGLGILELASDRVIV
jgi:two-component system, NarL family, response regulator LiaR